VPIVDRLAPRGDVRLIRRPAPAAKKRFALFGTELKERHWPCAFRSQVLSGKLHRGGEGVTSSKDDLENTKGPACRPGFQNRDGGH